MLRQCRGYSTGRNKNLCAQSPRLRASILKVQKESARGAERIASETWQPAKALSHVITVSRQQSLPMNEVGSRAHYLARNTDMPAVDAAALTTLRTTRTCPTTVNGSTASVRFRTHYSDLQISYVLRVISGFRGGLDENCAALRYYAARRGNSLVTFRVNLSVQDKSAVPSYFLKSSLQFNIYS